MARRRKKNITAIGRIPGVPFHDAWVSYTCVQCSTTNHVLIGSHLLFPGAAYRECVWVCPHCGFVHSRDSELPFRNWPAEHTEGGSLAAERFWLGFFRSATEHPESYWKQCNTCGRTLPFSAFSRHVGWGPLERQMECRACKGSINAVLNPKRTAQQMHEASIMRRVADVFLEGEDKSVSIEDLFARFGQKCFKTGMTLDVNDRGSWAIDHILPARYLYPLTKENAALLSREVNEAKRDRWPSGFYTNSELVRLAKITGGDLGLLTSKLPIMNPRIDVNRGVERYLRVRERSDLRERVKELRKILLRYKLVDRLSPANRKLLGL